VQRGEEIIIARDGEPIARLVPLRTAVKRVLGADRGLVKVADDFDAPLPPELLAEFEK
jgi:antitoxin (DNA-binding transcriptional repressor) of toxin-antitoxin stability system